MGSGVLDRDFLEGNFVARLEELEGRVKALEGVVVSGAAAERRYVCYAISQADVSNPPTTDELDAAFGSAASLREGFRGVVNDGGGKVNVWEVGVVDGAWGYMQWTMV